MNKNSTSFTQTIITYIIFTYILFTCGCNKIFEATYTEQKNAVAQTFGTTNIVSVSTSYSEFVVKCKNGDIYFVYCPSTNRDRILAHSKLIFKGNE